MKDELVVQRKIRRPRRLTAPRASILHIAQILAWADAWFQRTGQWPHAKSGYIPGTIGENWRSIDNALRMGYRGLPGGSSLARLLAERRGRRNRKQLPPLSVAEILRWADAHHVRTGQWPTRGSGGIPEAPGETWMAVEMALSHGQRGLPGGSSLARLLARHRGVRNHATPPSLSVEKVLTWIDAHHRRTGLWPTADSGPVHELPAENWRMIDKALRAGRRGLPGHSSLARLLSNRRGVMMKHRRRPPLTIEQILRWIDAHYRRNRAWPRFTSGPIVEAPGETWLKIDVALQKGERGLPGGGSLVRLLAEYRGVRNVQGLPRLTRETILSWIDAHHARTGGWPTRSSGPIPGTHGETWRAADFSLKKGGRGLPGGSSLARLLAEHRGVRNRASIGNFTIEEIRGIAKAHFERTGALPTAGSGPVVEIPGVTWRQIDAWLRRGFHGLPGGSSLVRLLQSHGRIAADGRDGGDGAPQARSTRKPRAK